MEIISKKSAIAAGMKRYFTGKRCRNGHIAPRNTANGTCAECSRANTIAWRAENPIVAAKLNVENVSRWRIKNPEKYAEQLAASKTRRLLGGDVLRSKKRAYYAKNRSEISARARAARLRHREQIDARVRKWRMNNRAAVLSASRNYRARLNNAEGAHGASDIAAIYAIQNGKCKYCGAHCGDKYHVDHMTPLFRGGSNSPQNLCIACPTCNISKGTKTYEEFMQWR